MSENKAPRCNLCPRMCGADRKQKNGFCKSGELSRAARAELHMWEEPCISGKYGSGAVFFSGCALGCVFCQNHEISHLGIGEEITDRRLSEIFLSLKERGAHNINLVNPTHFTPNILRALDAVKHKLCIPVVWNSSGYERAETIRMLSGYIDIFLPDLKYVTPEISLKYSGAAHYFEFASAALEAMFETAGYPEFYDDGMMKSGVLVRHLILPSHSAESKKVISYLAEHFDRERLWLSLMCQYFPAHRAHEYREISRRLTTLEYTRVLEHAKKCGIIHGFCQERSSADEGYVPAFSNKIT